MHISAKEYNFLTYEQNFYFGIIEDNKDPLEISRYRVRIFGIDTDDTDSLPTKSLPWAYCLNTTGLQSGIGLSRVLKQGTTVLVTLVNKDRNSPIILGTIEGINTSNPLSSAFTDPDKKYPGNYGGKSDHNTKATGENYLDSVVYETEGGHYIHFDDLNSKITVMHNSGTNIVINADGTTNVNSVKDINIAAANDINIQANGNLSLTSIGSMSIGTSSTLDVVSNGNLSFSAPRIDHN